jgi:hypothetical protein
LIAVLGKEEGEKFWESMKKTGSSKHLAGF